MRVRLYVWLLVAALALAVGVDAASAGDAILPWGP